MEARLDGERRSGGRKKTPEGSGGKWARREEEEGMNVGKEESVGRVRRGGQTIFLYNSETDTD